MRLVLLVTLFLSVALSQSRVVNGQIVDKDGRISRYEENNANDKVRVYRKPKSKKPFTNLLASLYCAPQGSSKYL